MPVISTLGAMSSRGFGEFNQQAQGKYIEDYFSTWLYTGTDYPQAINTGVPLSDTAAWSTFNLSETNVIILGVTTDSSGNVYAVGYADTGTSKIVVIKYNSIGVVQWQRSLQQGASIGYSVAVDGSGNVYVVGYANDGSSYGILAKYNSSGVIQWQRKLRQNATFLRGVTVNSTGDVYVTGYAYDGSNYYILLAKYDSSGAIQWQRKLQNGSTPQGMSVAVDPSGNVILTGFANDGANYIIIAKYNSSGTIQWQRKLTQSSSVGRGVACDSAGNIYVSGYASDALTYIILAKYNSSGVIQWKVKLRSLQSTSSFGIGVSVDSFDNVYINGYDNEGGANYDLIAKYNSSGTLQWQRRLQNKGTFGIGVSASSSGDLYIVGYYDNGLGAYNGYITKLKTDGTTSSGVAILSMATGVSISSSSSAADSASPATEGAGTATDSAGTATDSAGTMTASTATQSAVSGAGGMVWFKPRNLAGTNNELFDTARGMSFAAAPYLVSNNTNAQTAQTDAFEATASGFALGNAGYIDGVLNSIGYNMASWTWRKTPKFFDVQTAVVDGSGNLTINHSLGSVPGMVILKNVSVSGNNGLVYHRSTGSNNILILNSTSAAISSPGSFPTVTSTQFVAAIGTGATGNTYVAYLFAHDAGGFGLDGTQNVISCGSFTTNSGTTATVTLGYEPQFILVKSATSARNWRIFDTMRGWVDGGAITTADDAGLFPNLSNAETNAGGGYPTSTGFTYAELANDTYIYMAIRRGPMKVPTDATTVFSPTIYTGDYNTTTALTNMLPATDVWWNSARTISASYYVMDRLRGWAYFNTPSTAAENTSITWSQPTQTTLLPSAAWWGGSQSQVNYFFKRAPGFMDEVCYTGTGATAQNISHNLNSVPEMMILKSRNTASTSWVVYHKDVNGGVNPQNYYMLLQSNQAQTALTSMFNDTAPTSSVFTVGPQGSAGASGRTYVAYLFATCPGVSKVGSYTGTGATQTISCGFTGGARYVLIKRTDSTGDWWVWDTARGMVAGTDPRTPTNSATPEANANWVYTTTGGFQIVTSDATVNASGGTYIYLAIA